MRNDKCNVFKVNLDPMKARLFRGLPRLRPGVDVREQSHAVDADELTIDNEGEEGPAAITLLVRINACSELRGEPNETDRAAGGEEDNGCELTYGKVPSYSLGANVIINFHKSNLP